MVVSNEPFPPRKRRPSVGSFVLPNLSDQKLLQSLLLLSQEISNLNPLTCLLKRNSFSLIRKSNLLSLLFEELVQNPVACFPPSAVLCFEELYIVLQRIKTLIEDCSNGSKMWLLIQHELVANTFHEITMELSTALDIFPVNDLSLQEDVEELVGLIKKQCLEKKAYVDPVDDNLWVDVLKLLDTIEREVVPNQSTIVEVFRRLQLSNSTKCGDEIERLEEEVRNQTDKSKFDLIALVGLVRYGKCVLYGASTPKTTCRRQTSIAGLTFPTDFRCPISLDLMMDPVVVSTGQTYDRTSINLWIQSGHNTCPKTGQTLAHTELVQNRALKNLIAMWCGEQRIPFETMGTNEKNKSIITNKTALEATKMMVTCLINKLSISESTEMANRVVYELRALAKMGSDNRSCITEAGGLPLLVKFLVSDHSSLQVNAVTTILNLSIHEANKKMIMETDGVLNGVIEVLRSGSTWEAKGNAAATIFSLTSVHSYRKKIGKMTRVVKGLVDLAIKGPTSSKRDALAAILNLAVDRETIVKLIEGGVVEMLGEVMDDLPEETIIILEVIVRKGGLTAIVVACSLIKKLAKLLKNGTDRVQESAAVTLVNICRKGSSREVAELANVLGVDTVIWGLMGTGTERCKRKAATLFRIIRRWAAGLDNKTTSTEILQ